MIERKITFQCDDNGDTITMRYDPENMTMVEMFMKWVDFMSAIGYNMDKADMEDMWNGIPPEEEKITTESVIRNIIAEFEYQLLRQGIDHSNDPKWVNAREWCFKQWPSNEQCVSEGE